MATTTSIAVISVRGLESKDKWIQCAVAEARAAIAQMGGRQTEDLKVPGSIPGLGKEHFEDSESDRRKF